MVSKARQLAQKAGVPSGRRNLIINGAMQVAQRATSTTFDSSNTGYLALDRFSFYTNTTAAFTVSQSTDTPDGFAKSMKLDCTTADTSIAASHRAEFVTSLEGQNLQHFNFGSSSAKTLTISFWVKSSVTGDYAVSLYQGDEAGRRTQSQAYTVNVADTWEKKTITYSGDTSGQINDDNGAGLTIRFGLAVGSDYAGTVDNSWGSYTSDNTRLLAGHVANIASSTSNNFYITGIQFEVSTVATDFEHRSYGEELALCQRYFYRHAQESTGSSHCNFIVGMFQTTRGFFGMSVPVPMRGGPTISLMDGSTINLTTPGLTVDGAISSVYLYTRNYNNSRFSINCNTTTSTANVYRNVRPDQDKGFDFDAEL